MPEPISHLRHKAYQNERRFLEGPRSRTKEFVFSLQVWWEFIRGFRALHFIGPCVTVFGSARFKEDHFYYQQAQNMGARLSDLGFAVMTGGGPGIMEAANRGAYENHGRSIGCNIVLKHEQSPNRYLHKWVNFNHFFVRKTLLLKYSYAFVIMPGGWGTMDELFEALTLIQTGKIENFPVIIFGREYWTNLIELIDDMVVKGTVSPTDLDHLLITDSVEEAILHIKVNSIEKFGLKKGRRIKPTRVLGEWISWARRFKK